MTIDMFQSVYKQQMLDLREAGDRPDLVLGSPILLALEKLCSKTRSARTAFWSAYISFISAEWNESIKEKGMPETAAAPKPVPTVLVPPASLVTKTGRPLIPFTLPGLTSKP